MMVLVLVVVLSLLGTDCSLLALLLLCKQLCL